MASHYISSSIATQTFKLYKNAIATSQVIETLSQNAEIIVLDEYFGRTCEYHYVSSSTNTGFLLNQYIYPLSGTAESAPYICGAQSNPAYIEPNWYSLPETEPFINDSTNEYCVCITSDYLTPSQVDENEILKKGVGVLLRYYNKSGSYDAAAIDKYLRYYIFAKIKDNYVPFRPLMRTKHLVTIPVKYFDAIEDDKTTVSITPLERDLSEVDFILKINLKEMINKFNSLVSLLRLYNTDIITTNSSLVFSTSTLFGSENIQQNPGVDEMDFSGKAENIEDFKNRLENLLTINNYNSRPEVNMIDDINIQFAINSECNILYDVAIEVNGQCKKLRRAIEPFLRSEPVTDPTTVNFIRQIHNINEIDKCKVPWYDFAEQYVYPPVEVQASVIDDSEPSYEQFKKLFNLFISLQETSSQQPVKTLEQLIEEENQKFQYDLDYLTKSTPLLRFLYSGDNELDPTNLDVTFKKIRQSVTSPIANKDAYAIQEEGNYREVTVNKKNETAIKGEISIVNKGTFRIYTEIPRVTIDGYEKTLYFSSKQSQFKQEVQDVLQAIKSQLRKILDFLHKIGICKLVDLVWGCLTTLLRSLGVDVDRVIEVSVIKNFNYDQIINDVIPYLPAEQQQFLYQQLLTELGCVNQDAMLNILKTYLSSEEYTTLNLESAGATYEDVVAVVASKMIITTVSE